MCAPPSLRVKVLSPFDERAARTSSLAQTNAHRVESDSHRDESFRFGLAPIAAGNSHIGVQSAPGGVAPSGSHLRLAR